MVRRCSLGSWVDCEWTMARDQNNSSLTPRRFHPMIQIGVSNSHLLQALSLIY